MPGVETRKHSQAFFNLYIKIEKLDCRCSFESVTQYTRLLIEAVILSNCVRSKLKIKSVWGGNTATLPDAF